MGGSISGKYGQSKSKSKQGMGPDAVADAYGRYLPTTLQATSDANLTQLRGTGGDLARESLALNREISPEYYDAISKASAASGNLLDSINLGGLSPGEYNATERAVNQSNTSTGNAGLTNPMNIVNNAMNFGGAFNNKVGLAQGAINSATGVAGVAGQNKDDATKTALGGASPFNLGLLGSMTSAANAVGSSKSGGMNAGGELGAGVCCFIFLESYHGKLPISVRRVRDRFYRLHPSMARGYKKMANWLVPAMQSSDFVRWIVWKFMVKPATTHCEDFSKCRRISHFWLKVWSFYGNI